MQGCGPHRTAPIRAGSSGPSALARLSPANDAVRARGRASTGLRLSELPRRRRGRACMNRDCSSLLVLATWCGMSLVEMTLERVEMNRPETAERSKPRVDLHERLRFDAIDAPLRVDARLDEAGVTKHAQMLRNRGL